MKKLWRSAPALPDRQNRILQIAQNFLQKSSDKFWKFLQIYNKNLQILKVHFLKTNNDIINYAAVQIENIMYVNYIFMNLTTKY